MSDTNDLGDEAIQNAVRRTPQVISAEDLCGLADDDEDRLINARRKYGREQDQ
jgi:hypothetical protein